MVKKKIKSGKIIWLLSNQKGMALLTTLIFIFLLVTFAVALLTMTSNDIKLSAFQRDSTKAFYLAEAGIQRAIKELDYDFNWRDESNEFYNVSLGDGNYTLVAKGFNEGDETIPEYHVRIISTGKVNKPEREIIVFVKEAIDEGIHPIFNYAIAARGRIELQNKGFEMIGDVYCEGIIKNGEHQVVQGTGVATIDIEEYVEEEWDDVKIGDEYYIPFPTLDMEDYKSKAIATGTFIDESYSEVDGISSYELGDESGNPRIIYFAGDVHFKETTIIGPGVIVAEGTILIDNNSVCGLNSDDYPEYPEAEDIGIFSNSDENPAIKIAPSNTDIYGVIFAPNGFIVMQTNGAVYGSFIGGGGGGPGSGDRPVEVEASKGIFWRSTTIAEYLPNDDNITFSIVSWQEK